MDAAILMSLDKDTLVAITSVVTLLTALLLATFSKVVPEGIEGHRLWVIAFLMYSVSSGLGLVNGLLPFAIDKYLSAMLEVVAGCLLYAGVCRFFESPIPRRAITFFVTAEVVALAISALVADGEVLLTLSLTAARSVLPLGIGIEAWCHRPRSRALSGALLGAVAAISQSVVVALYALAHFSVDDHHTPFIDISQRLFQGAEMSLAIVGAVAMIQVVNDRIRLGLEFLASHDSLTGTLTRRAFVEQYRRELARSRRSESYPSVILLDVDNFKKINDVHGHATGDRVLQELCGIISGCLRTEDSLGRYGGEEFVVLLPGTSKEEAFHIAERVRATVEERNFGADGVPLSCTVSIGIAACCEGSGANESLDRADSAMYQAKAAGRNRTVLHPA